MCKDDKKYENKKEEHIERKMENREPIKQEMEEKKIPHGYVLFRAGKNNYVFKIRVSFFSNRSSNE